MGLPSYAHFVGYDGLVSSGRLAHGAIWGYDEDAWDVILNLILWD